MNNIKNDFDIIPNKYIILYTDENKEKDYIYLKDLYDIDIIQFILNNEEKNETKNDNISILKIYKDDFIENNFIKDTLFVIYTSIWNKSKNICNLLKMYNKYIVFQDEYVHDHIKLFFNNDDNKKKNLIDYSIQNFENIYNLLKNKNICKIEKNIQLIYLKNNNYINNNPLHIFTVFKKSNLEMVNIIQKKCIHENLKNKYVSKVIVLCNNDNYEDLINMKNENNEYDNLIIKNNYHENITFHDIFEIINNHYSNHIICLLRSDVVLPNQNSLDDLIFDINNEKSDFYCISRIERLLNGNLVKNDKLNRILYSTEQDAWIFKSPINININENIYFYHKYSELKLNKILKTHSYNIINDSNKYKIIHLLYDNNINNRPLLENILNKDNNNYDNIFLLPDNDLLSKVPFEQLIKAFNIDDNELYNLKCDLFNKYLRKNIMYHI